MPFGCEEHVAEISNHEKHTSDDSECEEHTVGDGDHEEQAVEDTSQGSGHERMESNKTACDVNAVQKNFLINMIQANIVLKRKRNRSPYRRIKIEAL